MNSSFSSRSAQNPCPAVTGRGPRMLRGVLFGSIVVGVIGGCSSNPKQETDLTLIQPAITTSGTDSVGSPVSAESVVENVDLISVDLINALSQIGGMHPAETVLQMEPPATLFGKALRTVLEQAGYGLRILPDADPSEVISHAVTKLGEEQNGVLNSYQIVVGDVRLKREYFEQPYGVTPSSNMFVIGANPSEITLNDELFELASTQTADVTPSETVVPVVNETTLSNDGEDQISAIEPALDPTLAEPVTPLPIEPVAIQTITPAETLTETSTTAQPVAVQQEEMPQQEPVQQADQTGDEPITIVPSLADGDTVKTFPTETVSAEIAPAKKAPLIQKLDGFSKVIIKGNMYELGRSNFTELLTDYSDMKKDILIFGNDSMRLGRENKRVLSTFVSDFLEDSDVISVIGCSHGRTNLTNGNAVLATGRAQRVKEALMFAGIPEHRIYEEGCWAPHHFDGVMPRRGVVITHKRERRNG